MPSTATITASTVLLGALSYLVYFDYQRRHSPEFRRELRRKNTKFYKEKDNAVKASKKQQRQEIEQLINTSLEESPLPRDLQAREQFFLSEIARADTLVNGGQLVEAALAFYRALMSYPQPMELLGLYEKSVQPQEVLELVRTMVVIRPPVAIANFIKESLGPSVE